MTKPTAPSTPEPQGEKCAHAPEIPHDLRAIYDAAKKADEIEDPDSLLVLALIERIALAESTLARERESREQTEAAAQRYYDWHTMETEEFQAKHPGYYFSSVEEAMCAVLSKPIPQEPAERIEETVNGTE